MLRVPAAAPHRVRQTFTAALPPAAWAGFPAFLPVRAAFQERETGKELNRMKPLRRDPDGVGEEECG